MADASNDLLELLPRKDRRHLMTLFEPYEMVPGAVLCEPGAPTHNVYFPTEGVVSLVGLNDGSPDLEVAMVGREGMLGAAVALGITTSRLRLLVQGEGMALRMGNADFRHELTLSAALRTCINRYLHVLMEQMTMASSCHRFHEIGPRLARWLLMSQDRSHDDNFHVTQEALAYKLGVRRVGVTNAAGLLQEGGLIEYRRGAMTVLDRKGLEAAACRCYAADREAYAALL